jgi:hypothetical protein
MKNISFLIGSGFSAPAGYPTTTELNKRLCEIDVSEISISTSKKARFLHGEPDPNAYWLRVEERKFVQDFLKFYCDVVLAPGQNFDYEIFYDYYMGVLNGEEYSRALLSFLDDFRAKNRVSERNDHLLSDFRFTFSQLIAQLLTKPLECVHLGPPYYPDYRAFFHLTEELAKTHRVHFHTLNHDLYMEHLAYSDSIGEMDDGFEELGSTFFGKISNKNGEYMVRLSRFINKFEKLFCLYKLHGSIDQFWFEHDHKPDLIKLKKGISNWEVHKEVEENGGLEYVNDPTDLSPDFLTGTTSKITRYRDGIYPMIFGHFESNLESSNTLIIIGYGFGDSGINKYIERDFVTNDSKTLFVVGNKRRPPAAEKFLARDRSFYLDGGVAKMDTEFILSNINP